MDNKEKKYDNHFEELLGEGEYVDFISNTEEELKEQSGYSYGDYGFYITDKDIERLKNGEIMIVTTNFGEYTCYFKYLKEK